MLYILSLAPHNDVGDVVSQALLLDRWEYLRFYIRLLGTRNSYNAI